MDTYEGRARLEWWANRSTILGGFDVRVTACAAGSDWTCEAILDGPLSADQQEVFDLLMQADPVFTLHFDEGSEILVNVAAARGGGRLALTVYEPTASVGP
ncbi:hypothetical protein ACFYVL_08775 [Streptomyces sp. NPDC004111]|uniref:hypothetical protein n=1 Tax=Streptomyces sp. NPDC004111 TaxID=3364690 RepID=UPI0036C2E839